MKRKILIPALILLVLAGSVAYYTATTKPHNMVITGIVTTNDVIVSAQIQGQLSQLLVKEGDAVKAGQLVAVIVPDELRADRTFYAHTEQGTGRRFNRRKRRCNIRRSRPATRSGRPRRRWLRRRRSNPRRKPTWNWTGSIWNEPRGFSSRALFQRNPSIRREPPMTRSAPMWNLCANRWMCSAPRSP